jgi:nucleotide-binding universal stress UspA family protein
MRGRPVLIGVDASGASREAVKLGSRIATAAGGGLHLVTAALDAISEVAATRLRLDPAPRLPSSLMVVPCAPARERA